MAVAVSPRARTIILTDASTVAFTADLAAYDGTAPIVTPTPTPTPAPVFSEQPSISPTSGEVGQTFSADDGTASDVTEYTRRWLLSGVAIGTGATVIPGAAGALVLEVTAAGPGGTKKATSAAVTVAANGTGEPDPEPQPAQALQTTPTITRTSAAGVYPPTAKVLTDTTYQPGDVIALYVWRAEPFTVDDAHRVASYTLQGIEGEAISFGADGLKAIIANDYAFAVRGERAGAAPTPISNIVVQGFEPVVVAPPPPPPPPQGTVALVLANARVAMPSGSQSAVLSGVDLPVGLYAVSAFSNAFPVTAARSGATVTQIGDAKRADYQEHHQLFRFAVTQAGATDITFSYAYRYEDKTLDVQIVRLDGLDPAFVGFSGMAFDYHESFAGNAELDPAGGQGVVFQAENLDGAPGDKFAWGNGITALSSTLISNKTSVHIGVFTSKLTPSFTQWGAGTGLVATAFKPAGA